MHKLALLATAAALCAALPARQALAEEAAPVKQMPIPDEAQLKEMNARFAPTELKVDLSALPAGEKAALDKIVEAARIMDALFLRQAWAGNETTLLELLRDRSGLGRERVHAFLINKGPWARLDHDQAFLPGVPPVKPEAANFYPAGSTKAELEAWLKTLAEPEHARASGFFTTVRREGGKLVVVPYSLEYQGELAEAARLLREAAALTAQPTLKSFLEKRAAAFLGNDYYESDLAWMELDASIEPTIGPYEVYEDGWFNSKAAFESFIGLRDVAETDKLAKLSAELQSLEDKLPIEPSLRNPKIGALAPIRVVNQIYCSGDANHGVQTAAYNLPNDERILNERGSKRVMLRNVQQAKFEKTLIPISKVALSPADQKKVSFDVFFTHILMHELMHGLGPHQVTGTRQTVRAAMQEAGSALEEAKADIAGLWALQQLVDKGVLDKKYEETMYVTVLAASAFRTLRFGLNEAHGRGMALQLNYLLDKGAVKVSPQGTFGIDAGKIKQAVAGLTAEIMQLQASGDTAKARAWLQQQGVLRPEVQKVIEKLKRVPTDIEPIFTSADALHASLAKDSK